MFLWRASQTSFVIFLHCINTTRYLLSLSVCHPFPFFNRSLISIRCNGDIVSGLWVVLETGELTWGIDFRVKPLLLHQTLRIFPISNTFLTDEFQLKTKL